MLPQTAVVKRHLEALPRTTKPVALLLPCITHYADFLAERKKIEQAAGLQCSVTCQVVRRSCQTYWDHGGLSGGQRGCSNIIGDYITGHSPRSVSGSSTASRWCCLSSRTIAATG